MKKLIAVMMFGITAVAYAVTPGTVNRSSFTQTNDTTACIVLSTGPAGSQVITPHYIDKVIVGGAPVVGALVVFNSTWTNTPIISSISLNTVQTVNFQDTQVKGLCYTTTGNTAGVTIIYKE